MNTILESQFGGFAAAYKSMVAPSHSKPSSIPPLTDAEQQVFQEASDAWQVYSTSSAGKTTLAAVPSMDLKTAQQTVADILTSSAFSALKNLLNTLKLDAVSFSIGLNFEAELIIGVTATIGAAIGIGANKGLASSEFLSVGLSKGIDEGAMTGVQFGLWRAAPSDMGGYAWATDVNVGFVVEASFAVSYTLKGGILGATMTIGGGEEDGIDEEESYTFILGNQSGTGDGYIKPAFQPQKSNLLILESFICDDIRGDGAGDENEVYFKFSSDDDDTVYHHPTYDYYSMKKGDTWDCGRSIWFDDKVSFEAFDEDDTSGDDGLLDCTIKLSDLTLGKSVEFTTDSSHGDADFKLMVRLIAQNVKS